MDRDLIEKALTAQVLTLAGVMKLEWHRRNSGNTTSNFRHEAVAAVRDSQADLIAELLAPPPPSSPDTAGG